MHKALILAAAIAALWSLLYLAFWLQVSGCVTPLTASCNEAPIRGLRDFIMLGWVMDYQTLVAAMVALGGAVIATRPVLAQLREMGRQSAATAVANFRIVAEEVETEMSEMEAIDRLLLRHLPRLLVSYDEDNWQETYLSWPDEILALSDNIFKAWQYLGNRIARADVSQNAVQQRGHELLRRMLDSLTNLHLAFRANTSGPDHENGEVDVDGEESARRRAICDEVFDEWKRWYQVYVQETLAKRADAWRQVRRLERIAAGEASSS